MVIEHNRTAKTEKSTTGTLSIDGAPFCVTLEDPERSTKIWGKTAIPSGTYKCILTWSPHFKREVVMLCGVPDFDRVYAHAGNTASDTNGCILVAKRKVNGDFIQGDSQKIEASLLKIVKDQILNGRDVFWKVSSTF